MRSIYKSIKLELRSFSLKLYDYLDSNIGMYLIESFYFMLIKSFLIFAIDQTMPLKMVENWNLIKRVLSLAFLRENQLGIKRCLALNHLC